MFYAVSPSKIAQVQSMSDVPPLITYAIPYFIVAILLECFVKAVRGRARGVKITDILHSINLGTFQELAYGWYGIIELFVSCYVWDNYRVVDFLAPDGALQYVGLLLVVDFGYYWFHRSCHEWHLLWAAHHVHHSGEDYNLATALRQGALQAVFKISFIAPVSLVFPPAAHAVHRQLNTLYQFWIHTEEIGSLGPLEYIMNTPSHHRMHHRPPGNCNYAGLLIIWDRMFGTFVPEDKQRDYYGLAKAYTSFNPVLANFEHFRRLYRSAASSVKPRSFLGLLVKRRVKHKMVCAPGALFKAFPETKASLWNIPTVSERVKLTGDAWTHRWAVQAYMGLLFLGSTVCYLRLKDMEASMSTRHVLMCQALLVWLMVSVGSLSQSRSSGLLCETARVVVCGALPFVWKKLDAVLYVGGGGNAVLDLFGMNADTWTMVTLTNAGVWASVVLLSIVAGAFSSSAASSREIKVE